MRGTNARVSPETDRAAGPQISDSSCAVSVAPVHAPSYISATNATFCQRDSGKCTGSHGSPVTCRPVGRWVAHSHQSMIMLGLSWIQSGAIIALIGLLYAGAIPALVREWLTRPGASHGILIPPLVAMSLWLRAPAIRARAVRPCDRGIWVLLAACALYILGAIGAEHFLTRLSLPVMIGGLILTFQGVARFRALIVVLALFATMIPLPGLVYNTLTAPLQTLASYLATELAQTFGVVVHRDGNVIHMAEVTLGVAEACSGLNSLSTLVVTALVLSPLYRLSSRLRVCLVIAAVPLAIASNILRIAGTALLADYRPELALGFYHSVSGWVVFMAAFLGLLATAAIFQWWHSASGGPVSHSLGVAPANDQPLVNARSSVPTATTEPRA